MILSGLLGDPYRRGIPAQLSLEVESTAHHIPPASLTMQRQNEQVACEISRMLEKSWGHLSKSWYIPLSPCKLAEG